MSSYAAPPEPASRARIESLFHSGRLKPLRPFVSAWQLSGRSRLDADGQVICRATAALSGELGFTRLDIVCPPNAPADFTLLEVQAGDPSAMGWHGALSEALGEAPALMLAHRRAFEQRTKGRSIAFVVKRGSIVESDHRLLADHYAANGWTSVVVDPAELTFRQGHLFARDTAVDAVFRDALDELMPTPGGPALTAALDAHAVTLMNPMSAAAADDKSLLEPLSTPERWDAETARVLCAHVPCTRVVRERRCEWEGRDVDLPAHLKQGKGTLVLKPVDGYGGIGVTVGPFVTDAQWAQAVGDALAKPGRFVVQRYQALPRQSVFALEGPKHAYIVHSLWFCPGLVGAFMRGSETPIVNVHQGGGLAPVFFTD